MKTLLIATFVVSRMGVLLQMTGAHVWVRSKALVRVATLLVLLRLLLVLGALNENPQLLRQGLELLQMFSGTGTGRLVVSLKELCRVLVHGRDAVAQLRDTRTTKKDRDGSQDKKQQQQVHGRQRGM